MIRVVDLSCDLSARYAARLLADHGCEVVAVALAKESAAWSAEVHQLESLPQLQNRRALTRTANCIEIEERHRFTPFQLRRGEPERVQHTAHIAGHTGAEEDNPIHPGKGEPGGELLAIRVLNLPQAYAGPSATRQPDRTALVGSVAPALRAIAVRDCRPAGHYPGPQSAVGRAASHRRNARRSPGDGLRRPVRIAGCERRHRLRPIPGADKLGDSLSYTLARVADAA